jgi:hypothetical protein
MSLFRRLVPLLLLAAAAWSYATSPARAQTPSARFAFADTTLLRDTLDISFERLFPLADSLRVTPDSLRAFAIRYQMPLERLVFLADSLGMPVDSVGPVLAREQFNPLARRAEHQTTFGYTTTYGVTRQSTSWGNNVSYDLVRGPVLLRNVTTVRIDRIPEGTRINFYRTKTANTEGGWKLGPDVALGTRINLQRTETFRLGSQRTTSQNDYQASMRSKHDFGPNRSVSLNLFGGPFSEPKNSLSNASKSGLGTNADGRIEYAPGGWYGFDINGNATLRRGHAAVPGRVRFDTRDVKWGTDGTFNLFPESPATVRVTTSLSHDQTERPTSFTRITPIPGSTASDTVKVDDLIQEPSGNATIQTAVQLLGGALGSLQLTGNLGRTTRLLATEEKQGITFDRQISHQKDINVDGQLSLKGWSLDGHFTNSIPDDEGPRRSIVNVTRTNGSIDAVTVDYRERGTTQTRSLNGKVTRRITPALNFQARGDVGLTSYRYAITDSAYLGLTSGERVATSDPHDDYRQTLKLETTYAASSYLSSTIGLEVGRVLTVYLRSDRSGSNREDRLYRTEWLWTYRLFSGLTANQRNQLNATYSRSVYSPSTNRLNMSFATITTLNARVSPRLTIDLTHNSIYSPNGGYTRALDGLEYFNVSDATRDYTLTGRIAYAPVPAFQLNLTPNYQASYRDDRSGGGNTPTQRRRQLSLAGGANLNLRVGNVGRLTGNITRNLDALRVVTYTAGRAQPQPRSQSDYWSGQLQFAWGLR